MQKQNIVDHLNYHDDIPSETHRSISEELTTAIQNLIHRLREQEGPLTQTG